LAILFAAECSATASASLAGFAANSTYEFASAQTIVTNRSRDFWLEIKTMGRLVGAPSQFKVYLMSAKLQICLKV
jgi:hypothetical protein